MEGMHNQNHELPLLPLTERDRSHLAAMSTLVDRASSEVAPISSFRLGRAWARALRLQLSAATAIVQAHRPAWSFRQPPCRARGELDMFWSFICLLRDEGASGLARADSAKRRATEACSAELSDVLLRSALWLMGDIQGFSAAPRPALSAFGARRRCTIETFIRRLESAVELQQLRLGTAERLARLCELNQPQGRTLKEPFLLPAVIKAEIAYERGQLLTAESQLCDLSGAIQGGGFVDTAVRAYTVLSRAAFHLGRTELASATLQEGELLAQKRDWPRLAATCIFERAQMLITLGRLDEAEAHISRLGSLLRRSPEASPTDGHWQVTVQWAIANNRLELFKSSSLATASTIQRGLEEAVSRGDLRLGVELGMHWVEALTLLGETSRAKEVLEHIFGVSADAGLFQTVIAGGPVVRKLLAADTPNGTRAAHVDLYARALLEAWPEAIPTGPPRRQTSRSGCVLTRRELGVLQLMSLGNSNKRIAQELGIAPETVKSHAKRIFSRLGASTRTEAVFKASRLGIV